MKKLLSPSDKSIMKGNGLLSGIFMPVALIVCCALLFTGVTWAWFTASTSTQLAEIVAANYKTELVVTDQDGNVIEPDENGLYNFDENTRYTVTITASGTASTGFSTFSVNGEEYPSIQLAPGESISFDIFGYSSMSNGDANWGTSSSQDPVFDGDLRFVKNTVTWDYNYEGAPEPVTANYEEGEEIVIPADPVREGYEFLGWLYSYDNVIYKSADLAGLTMPDEGVSFNAQWQATAPAAVIKLMPKAGTTTMIERGGKVETTEYNSGTVEGFNNAGGRTKYDYVPVGVQTVEYAYNDVYEHNAGDYSYSSSTNDWFIYGLATGLTETTLADYIEVSGDGRYVVEGLKRGKVVTGTTVSVYDRKGTVDDENDDVLIEKFYVVIVGDVNCDGVINSSDATAMNQELKTHEWTVVNPKPYMVRAANVNKDSTFSSTDITAFNPVTKGTHTINQVTGKVVAKS